MKSLRDRVLDIGTDIRMSDLERQLLASAYRSVKAYRAQRDFPRALRDEDLLKALLVYFEKKYPQ